MLSKTLWVALVASTATMEVTVAPAGTVNGPVCIAEMATFDGELTMERAAL
jgi:hypothetical protein